MPFAVACIAAFDFQPGQEKGEVSRLLGFVLSQFWVTVGAAVFARATIKRAY